MTDIVEDHDFWVRVAYLASGWLRDAPEAQLRSCWIDDFTPARMKRRNSAAEVYGEASVVQQAGSMDCEFVASIPWPTVNRSRTDFEIDEVNIDEPSNSMKIVLKQKTEKPNQPVQTTAASRRF